jgi:short-subunit dehydrogenase
MTALITGASVGIGYELAKVCAKNGHNVVLVARNQPQLERVAAEIESGGKVKARVLVKDLAQPDASREIFDELMNEGVQVEVLINNAGFGNHGKFAETELDADLRLLQVNIVALTALTKLFLREMLTRGRGRVLNVASTAAFLPGPFMATYYASKAYVLHFSEAVAREVAGRGVSVTALCPGPVNTEFQKRAGITGSRLFKDGAAMDPAKVALAGYRGMMHGRRVVIPGVTNNLMMESIRLVPRRLATFIAGKLNEVH